ncbi:MAG: cytochrome c oxidase subunit II [Alphaproteobacteria bacterium]|nr:cytochrome c oxidase subunit II [Alphaproteobacteria bacterium]
MALADQPHEWGLGLQQAASPVMEDIRAMHNHLLLPIIFGIVIFVTVLLLYVMIRFNKRANPVPSSFTHNTAIEVIWTVVPVLILVIIAIPSFKLLYKADHTDDPEMTLKVTSNQWYWSYSYPDNGDFSFDSNLLEGADLPQGALRLLTVDNKVVLPVDTNIRILLTSSDVLHNWTVPAFGVKIDTVPGRLRETWVRITKEGTYYGQCSELCGVRHAYMPIEVQAVSKERFAAWVKQAQAKYGSLDATPTKLAAAQ